MSVARRNVHVPPDGLRCKAIAKAAAGNPDGRHSDLDNEQPITITVTLGDWRRLNRCLPQHRDSSEDK